MAAVGIVAYTLGRTIVRSLRELAAAAGAVARGKFEQRVPVRGRDEFAALGTAFNDMAAQLEERLRELAAERGRLREAIGRFGEALAATHDPYALLPVIVESAVEATGAQGGRLVVDGKEIAREGDPGNGDRSLVIPLGNEGREGGILYLTPKATTSATRRASWRTGSARRPRSRSRTRGSTGSSSGRPTRTGSPSSRTGATSKRRSRARSPAPSASAGASHSSSPTWTTSSRSTTATAIRPATTSCRRSPTSCARPSARSTCRRGTAARSSPSSFPRPTSTAPSGSPSGCARHWPRARCRRTPVCSSR